MRADQKLHYAGRAVFGVARRAATWRKHNEQQKALVEQAFGKLK